MSVIETTPSETRGLTAASKVIEKELFEFGASTVGINSNGCSTHSSGVLCDSTATLPKISPVMLEISDALKLPE